MQNPFVPMTDAERAERRAQFFAMVAEMGPEPTGGALAWNASLLPEAQQPCGKPVLAQPPSKARVAGHGESTISDRP